MTASLAAGTRLTRGAVSAGPVVAIVGIVAVVAIILVVVVSYVLHHRALSEGGRLAPQWPTQLGSKPSLSAEVGKDEISR